MHTRRDLLSILGTLLSFGCARAPQVAEPPRTPDLPDSVVACGTDVPLPAGTPVMSSSVIGEHRMRPSCTRGVSPECTYRLHVPERSEVRLSLETLDFDGVLALFVDDEAAGWNELGCVDDTPLGDSHHARLETTLAPGEYLVLVEGATEEAGQFSLFVELDPLQPVEQVCEHARALESGVSVRGSTRGAGNHFTASCAGGAEGPDRVHSFVLTEAARVRIRQQSEHDAALHLRARCAEPQSELACNDYLGEHARSMITSELPPGTYYVVSDSFSRGQSGDYVLSLEERPVPRAPSVSAWCAEASARVLAAGEYELDTLEAPSVLAGHCGGEGAPERLFALDLREENTVLLDLVDPEFNAVLYIRAECEDERSELNCVRASNMQLAEARADSAPRVLAATLGPGRYIVGVDGVRPGEMGAARLRVRFAAMSVAP